MGKSVEVYLRDLETGKEEKPDQVKQGIEVYIELWRKAVSLGVVSGSDEIGVALEKIESKGGLYRAAEG